MRPPDLRFCQRRCHDTIGSLRTVEIAGDSRLDQSLHPLSNDQLFIVTEAVCLIRVMDQLEAITSRVHFLICYDPVAYDVDVSLDFGFLTKA